MSEAAVYVIPVGSNPSHFKIGCSSNLSNRYQSKRIRGLITHRIASTPDGVFELEEMIHKLFSQFNVNGHETFSLGESEIGLLRDIEANSDPKQFVAILLENRHSTGTLKCNRCGSDWQPRKQGKLLSCPRCKRYDWEKP